MDGDCAENADCMGIFTCMCSNGYSGDSVNNCINK